MGNIHFAGFHACSQKGHFNEESRYQSCYMIRLVLSLILVAISLSASAQTAAIRNTWIESNCKSDNLDGSRIHVEFTVEGMNGKKVNVLALFYDQGKNLIKTSMKGYQTTTNDVCSWSTGDCHYENSHFKDFKLFIPNDAFYNSPRNLYYRIFIRDANNREIARTDFKTITIRGDVSNSFTNPDGSTCTFTNHEDGSSTFVSVSGCFMCFGTRRCQACGGKGSISYGYGEYMRINICAACAGTGICQKCKGTGKTSSYVHYDPKTNMSTFVDLITGQTKYSYGLGDASFGSSTDNSNSYSSPSTTNSKKRCTFCNGTGLSPIKSYGPDFTGSGKQGHYHETCPACRGLGYY